MAEKSVDDIPQWTVAESPQWTVAESGRFQYTILKLKKKPQKNEESPKKPDLAEHTDDPAANNASASKDTATNDATTMKETEIRSCAYPSCPSCPSSKLRVCRKCLEENITKRRFYCSKECQTLDWSLRHRAFHKQSSVIAKA